MLDQVYQGFADTEPRRGSEPEVLSEDFSVCSNAVTNSSLIGNKSNSLVEGRESLPLCSSKKTNCFNILLNDVGAVLLKVVAVLSSPALSTAEQG